MKKPYFCRNVLVCIIITRHMKKTYLTPENRVKDLELEWNFLLSGLDNPGIGSLDDPEDDDPWGSN